MSFYGSWIIWGILLHVVASAKIPDAGSLNNTHFDYIVVGGGTAGLVIANRLSENPNNTVLIIEAGDFEFANPNVTTIETIGIGKDTDIDWQYQSEPQIYGGGQSLVWSAGKGVGGSSLINGMTYIRPASSQIDLWPSLGLELNWSSLFAVGKSGEAFQPPGPNLTALGAAYEASAHGFDGPLATCITPHMTNGDLHSVLNDTFKSLDIHPRPEFDGGDLLGFGVQAVTQDGRNNIREDSGRAYYYPVEDRPNLMISVNTTGLRILWAPDGTHGDAIASSVQVMINDGSLATVQADKEVVLSAGAIRSPAILEHSGVGNPSILSQQNIDVKVNLPAVGENFQDQTTIAIISVPLKNYSGFPPFVAHASLTDLFGSATTSLYEKTLAEIPGYAATIAAQNGGSSSADVQEQLLRSQLDLLMNSNTPATEIAPGVFGPLIGAVFWPLQPFSRGSVHINSSDAAAQPAIDGRFFQFDFDGRMAVQSARFTRKALMTAPLSDIINMTSLTPSPELLPDNATDEVWLDWIKTNSSYQPNYHHLGSCAMLPRQSGGVVDNDFKVYGTQNVRVVDLSVIPLQVAGHSTALLYAVAEWAAKKLTG